LIKGVKVGLSPDWLRRRLESIGLRPINNIVDITNFVLMEMGQPLHAFDLAKLDGGIHVRQANDGETLLALDGETYELKSQDTVVADSKKALAIAGVMGGEGAGVTETTEDILLESAYFEPPKIRKTSHRLMLSSDSSYRFERGVDPQQVLGASDLATKLVLELAGGDAASDIQVAGTPPTLAREIKLDHAGCRQLLGADIEDDRIVKILGGLGLEKTSLNADISTWKIPSYRLDLGRSIDLIEEVARIFGLDEIPSKRKALTSLPRPEDDVYDLTMRLKRRLVSLGFCETPTLSMVSEGQIESAAAGHDKSAVPIKNPLGTDYKMMRTTLLSGLTENELSSGLLNVASRNAKLGAPTARVFEVGRVFSKKGEETLISMLIAGNADDLSWMTPRPRSLSIHDMRGVIEAMLPSVPLRVELLDDPHLSIAADLLVDISGDEMRLGRFGQCELEQSRKIGYVAVLVAELRLQTIEKLLAKTAEYKEISPYPAITRDVAMEIDGTVTHQAIGDFFRSYKEDLLESYSLFDVFADPTGEKLDASKKSLAYSLTYRSKKKTLESKVVDKTHAKVLLALQEKLGVSIR
jgi:phenylalanyl-tRNA synthetase beta chain